MSDQRAPVAVSPVPFSVTPVHVLEGPAGPIPSFLTSDDANLDRETVESFGREWTRFDRFSEQDVETGGREYFADLLPDAMLAGARVLDVGCGSGRWTRYLARRAAFVDAVDPSPAVHVAARATADCPNVRIAHASAGALPYPPNAFDLIASVGVLHHVPDTAAAIRRLVPLIRPGGYLYLYLYYKLDDRRLPYRAAFAASQAVRAGVSRLPSPLKEWVCELAAIGLYAPFIALATGTRRLLPHSRAYEQIPLHYYVGRPWKIVRNDARDRFGTPLERRFSKAEITAMLVDAGLGDVRFGGPMPPVARDRAASPARRRGDNPMKPRVLRVIARLNVGGPAIHATLLTRHLEHEGFESMLVAGGEGPDEGNYLELHGGSVATLRIIPDLGREISPLRDLGAYRALVAAIRAFRPQIVHTHTAKAGLLGRLAAWRCGVPVVVHTYHGHVFHGYFSPAKTAVFVAIERLLARLSTRLLAVSEQVRDDVLARGIGRPDQFEIMRLGLDLTRFEHPDALRGEFKRGLGLDATTPLIGIVARLVPIKAHEVFVAMAVEVARARPDAVFAIVGDGETRAVVTDLVSRAGLGERVRFVGWRADLDRVYADLDVVVLTSRNEGSPVALIEAMASARPVVSTSVGGVRELVGDAGLLCAVDDAAGLAKAVLAILDSPALAEQLGRAGRARVIPAYSEGRLVADMAALYKRLLSRHEA